MTKILSLCCGAGGIDEGLKQAGFSTTLAVDFNPINVKFSQDALKTIKLNHPDTETLHENILNIEENLGKFDIVVGGPPCPEFSVANINRSYDDTLVKCFWRIVKNTGAKYWLMENVPGVIKVCKLRNFLVNCVDYVDYGTPQKRVRRLYTNLRVPICSHMENPFFDMHGIKKEKWVSVKEALQLKNGVNQDRKTTFEEGFGNNFNEQSSPTLLSDCRLWITKSTFNSQNGSELSKSIEEPAPTIMTGNDFKLTNYKIYSRKYLEGKSKNAFKARKYFHEIDQPSRTILTKDIGVSPSMMVADNKYARKLTNEECAILQGFPKDYQFFGTKTSVKKQIGNALPPQPIKALFDQLN